MFKLFTVYPGIQLAPTKGCMSLDENTFCKNTCFAKNRALSNKLATSNQTISNHITFKITSLCDFKVKRFITECNRAVLL